MDLENNELEEDGLVRKRQTSLNVALGWGELRLGYGLAWSPDFIPLAVEPSCGTGRTVLCDEVGERLLVEALVICRVGG